jgi:hypothetical protein
VHTIFKACNVPSQTASNQLGQLGERLINAKGIGMKTIQRLMGHQHISTTALYCDVSNDTLRMQ